MGTESEEIDSSQISGGTDDVDNDNPAWSTLLQSIPSQFHDQVKPALTDWDKGVQERFQKIRSEYAPWKPFMDQGIDPEQMESAIQLANAIQSDPKRVIEGMVEFYGINLNDSAISDLKQQLPGSENTEPIDPRIEAQFQQFKEMQDTMAQILIAKKQEEQANAEDVKLDLEYRKLHGSMSQKYGYDFDENIVSGIAYGQGVDIAKAAEMYYEHNNSFMQKMQRPAPSVLGHGGSLPSTKPNIRGTTDKEFKDIAVEFIRAHNRQSDA